MKVVKALILAQLTFALNTNCKTTESYGDEYDQEKVYKSIRSALKSPEDVRILDLSYHQLKEVPRGISELTKLEILNLRGNQITELPAELWTLSNLRVLNLTDNRISEVPSEINKLTSLRKLELMKNYIDDLPEEIVNLKNLERINVAYNEVTDQEVIFIKEALPECFIITEIVL